MRCPNIFILFNIFPVFQKKKLDKILIFTFANIILYMYIGIIYNFVPIMCMYICVCTNIYICILCGHMHVCMYDIGDEVVESQNYFEHTCK